MAITDPPAPGQERHEPEVVPTVEHVYRSHAGVVRRALRSFGVDPAVLDDAVQDVFVVLVRRCDDYDGRASVTSWLWGIARRVARGYRRGAGRRERLHAVLRRMPGEATLDDALARRRALEFLDAFLAELPPALLEAFVLAELDGFTAPEIAAQTGANLNTIYARIRAVRRRFDRAIADALAPPRKLGALWLLGGSWWTPAATTACAALTIHVAELVPDPPPQRPTAATAAAEPRIARVPAKSPSMPGRSSKSTKLLTPVVVMSGMLAAPLPAEAKPKPRRAKVQAVQRAALDDADADAAARKTGAGPTTIYEYDESDHVEGEVLRPTGQPVRSRGDARMQSLLEVRGHFLPELIVLATDV